MLTSTAATIAAAAPPQQLLDGELEADGEQQQDDPELGETADGLVVRTSGNGTCGPTAGRQGVPEHHSWRRRWNTTVVTAATQSTIARLVRNTLPWCFHDARDSNPRAVDCPHAVHRQPCGLARDGDCARRAGEGAGRRKRAGARSSISRSASRTSHAGAHRRGRRARAPRRVHALRRAAGSPVLRERIAEHLAQRGVRANPEHVLVTPGAKPNLFYGFSRDSLAR